MTIDRVGNIAHGIGQVGVLAVQLLQPGEEGAPGQKDKQQGQTGGAVTQAPVAGGAAFPNLLLHQFRHPLLLFRGELAGLLIAGQDLLDQFHLGRGKIVGDVLLLVLLHTEQPADGYMEQAAESHQFVHIGQTGIRFPFINRLSGYAESLAQPLLGQIQLPALGGDTLSGRHGHRPPLHSP